MFVRFVCVVLCISCTYWMKTVEMIVIMCIIYCDNEYYTYKIIFYL